MMASRALTSDQANASLPLAACARLAAMRARSTSVFLLAVGALLTLAPAAMAADGVGLYGRTDDKVITFFASASWPFSRSW